MDSEEEIIEPQEQAEDLFGDDIEDQENADKSNEPELDENGDPILSKEVLSKLNKLKSDTKKRNTRPQPKLNDERLLGPNGLELLLSMSSELKWSGNDVRDFDQLVALYEHWAHRMFPKMTFDEVVRRCEALGAKKNVQRAVREGRGYTIDRAAEEEAPDRPDLATSHEGAETGDFNEDAEWSDRLFGPSAAATVAQADYPAQNDFFEDEDELFHQLTASSTKPDSLSQNVKADIEAPRKKRFAIESDSE